MMLKEIIDAINTLSDEELALVQEHIHQKRATRFIPDYDAVEGNPWLNDEWVIAQMQEILKDVPPTPMQSGTMDVEKLLAGIKAIRDELTDEELEDVIVAINEKYIPQVSF